MVVLLGRTPAAAAPPARAVPLTTAAAPCETVAAAASTALTLDHPDFPQFGAGGGLSWSFGGDGATPFALVLGGRSHLALIGRDGVGWRTSTRALLAIFDPGDDAPQPLAGIVVERTIAALDQARVLPPVLEPHQP